jgi:hypothetical protein
MKEREMADIGARFKLGDSAPNSDIFQRGAAFNHVSDGREGLLAPATADLSPVATLDPQAQTFLATVVFGRRTIAIMVDHARTR